MGQECVGAPVLEVTGVWKSFGGSTVVRDVDVALRAGEVVALLGENGAGKSTLLKVMSGVLTPDRGTIRRSGEQVDLGSPRDAQGLGISLVHQELNLAANRTVAQNVLMGREPLRRMPFRLLGVVDRGRARRAAEHALTQVHSSVSSGAPVSRLSVAQQQLIEIAKAISVDGVEVVLMDEPTAALPEHNVRDLFDLIGSMRDRGLAVVLTTHRLTEAFAIADRIVIMRDGEKVAEVRRGDEAATEDQVIRWMVGRPVSALFPNRAESDDRPHEVALAVRGLSSEFVHDVSFDVRRGEILGFGGLVGAGRTELARCLFGVDRRHAGEVVIDGASVSIGNPAEAVRAGMGLVPEDRKLLGLVQGLSVRQNLLLPGLDGVARFGLLQRTELERLATELVDRFDIRAKSPQQLVRHLSGGNQQKVVLAKWLLRKLRVLILDEPTRGVDVGARAEIYDIVRRLASDGTAVLLLSSDMEELLGLSDRVAVMAGGRITTVLDRASATGERVLAAATGLAEPNLL